MKNVFNRLSKNESADTHDSYRLYRAKVVDVKDPKKVGRVKVWLPDLMHENVEDNSGFWVMPGNNIYTCNGESKELGIDDCGACNPPPKDSYVWVWFEDGDYNLGFYGSGINLLEEKSVPVENQYGDKYHDKWTLIKTPQGRQIMLSDDDSNDESVIIRGKYRSRGKRDATGDPRKPDDSMYIEMWEKPGEEYIIAKDGLGQYLLIDEANKKIRIQHISGSYIEMLEDGDIHIQAAKNIHLNSFAAKFEKHM